MLRHQDTGTIVGFNVVDDAGDCQLVLGGAKFWAWKARDWSDGEPKVEMLGLQFDPKVFAVHFRGEFDSTKTINKASDP